MSFSRPLLTALAACAFLGLPGTAGAAGWLPPVTLEPTSSAPSGTSGATTASNAAGAQAVTWNNNMSNSDGGAVCLSGEVVSRTSGGAWSASTLTGCNVILGIAESGEVVAVWVTGTKLYAASGFAGQPLGAPVLLESSAYNLWFPVVRFSPAGVPTIAWAGETVGIPDSSYQLRTITRNANGSWPATPAIVANASAYTQPRPDLAFGPSGDAVIAYNRANSTGNTIQVVYGQPPFTSWTPQGALGPLTIFSFDYGPRVRFDPQGRATVLEANMTSGAPTTALNTWTRGAGAGGVWGSTQTVPNSTGSGIVPGGDLAFDSAGNGVVAFIHGTGSAANVRVATRGAGGSGWSSGLVKLLGSDLSSAPSTPDVAFDSNDNATIAFSQGGALMIFYRAAGTSVFGPQSLPVGISGSNPVIATDSNGYLIATWTDANGRTSTSVYDPVAPVIDSLDAPTAATAGEAASFTVNGSDVWGPVTFSIDFGDGQPPAAGRLAARAGAAGARGRASATTAVQHVYAQPGTYDAVVTVTDGVGNTTSLTRAVAVAQAPGDGPAGPPPVAGLPDPKVGVSLNLATVKPVVRVREPGSKTFVALVNPRQVRMGSIVDARKGRVRITIADGTGKLHTADFYEGMFKVLQRPRARSVAALQLFGGSFRGCPKAPRPVIFSVRSKKRSVRHLWGSGSGRFRTVGRFSSATLRGTTWLTDDRCNGTVTRVKQGKVVVRDFAKRRTVVLRAPRRYLAQPRRRG